MELQQEADHPHEALRDRLGTENNAHAHLLHVVPEAVDRGLPHLGEGVDLAEVPDPSPLEGAADQVVGPVGAALRAHAVLGRDPHLRDRDLHELRCLSLTCRHDGLCSREHLCGVVG